mgnify:CR=1 FL=1
MGAQEVGFTVLSISVSLIAVFIPILFMGGIVGRLFREFAMTLATAIMISLLISLTTTPMICAYMLRPDRSSARLAKPSLPSALPTWNLTASMLTRRRAAICRLVRPWRTNSTTAHSAGVSKSSCGGRPGPFVAMRPV